MESFRTWVFLTQLEVMSEGYENPKEASQKKFHNQTSGSTLKNMAYGGQFLGSRTPKIDFC